MAENIITTRILLRYDTYNRWMISDSVLKVGEAAVCSFPNSHTIDESNIHPENTPPAIGIKIGDGIHPFRFLPWVQAIAADVYNWAKSPSKPTYTAQEIEGLQNYIEEHTSGGGSGGGDTTTVSRLYQIVRGTGDNINKYYLQYRENIEDSQWVIDTSHYIDVDDFVKVANWIGTDDLSEYPDLSSKIAEQILIILNYFDYNDNDVAHQFVTSVSQNDGLISVTRAQPTFSDILGQIEVSQGGTGVNSIPQNQVMIGNGENPITTIPIADEISNNNSLVPNYLVKQYVDNAVSGLAHAMHFIGEASVVIENNSNTNPNINGYDFSQVAAGDVILSGEKEFVWTGGAWQLLGDEGSYAVKGSIKNVDIAEDAAISQSKIANLSTDLNNKVDKIEGKQLSTNDYTTEEKNKLNNIEDEAQVNNIEHIFVNGMEINPTTISQQPKSVNIQYTLTQEEKEKLNDIEEGAQVNKIETISFNGGEPITPNNNKNVDITIDQAALKLNVLEGARYPSGINSYTSIDKDSTGKILELSKVAATGDIDDLLQTSGTYITLYCGTSTEVV